MRVYSRVNNYTNNKDGDRHLFFFKNERLKLKIKMEFF